MNNKRILIYLEEDRLRPAGGPYAVGYYLYNRLKTLNVNNIDFLKSRAVQNSSGKKQSLVILKPLLNLHHALMRFKRYYKMIYKGNGGTINLNQYDIIHFHTTRSMYEIRKSLDIFKGKVIITSHSPVPLAQELRDEQLSNIEKKLFRWLYSKLPKMDEYAFQRADIIQFPCKEAEEPYYNNWKLYAEIHKNNKDKYRYLPTGIPGAIPKRERAEIRKELGIDDSKILISYVGRHNYVKGYDQLKIIGDKLLANSADYFFVIAGTESPLKGLSNPSWHEVGWTTDAHSYINASDIFILPNKETYFDIILLEVLSLGKIVVASRTGGNKYFAQFNSPGIFLYDNVDSAVKIIKNLEKTSKTELIKMGEENKKLFYKYFTDEVYVNGYLKLIETI